MDRVPAIDIQDFYTGDAAARRVVGQAIGRACEAIGFFQVVGHRVPASLIEDAVRNCQPHRSADRAAERTTHFGDISPGPRLIPP